jgi:hypothetical protein
MGRIHLIAPAQPQRPGAGQARPEPVRLRSCLQGQLGGVLDQLHVRDAAAGPPLVLPANGPAGHPRPGTGGQLDIHRAKMAGGQRLGCMPEHRGLVAGVEHVPRAGAHHHHLVIERKDDPPVCRQARKYSCSS